MSRIEIVYVGNGLFSIVVSSSDLFVVFGCPAVEYFIPSLSMFLKARPLTSIVTLNVFVVAAVVGCAVVGFGVSVVCVAAAA